MNSAHGQLPVPGPAVTALARGVPVYSAGPARELTTPTGLALLCTLAQDYGPLPPMRPSAIGYGAGSADLDGWPNVLRVFLAESLPASIGDTETVVQMETNLDDLNPQAYETVMDRLFAAGALDVTLTQSSGKQCLPPGPFHPPSERAEGITVLNRYIITALVFFLLCCVIYWPACGIY